MSSDHLLSRKDVDAQYRPRGYGLSPGLQRARAPFRVRNAVTGILVGTFAVSVWAYSIRAVKQDTFEDVDEEAKAMLSARTRPQEGETVSRGAAAAAPVISNDSPTLGTTSTDARPSGPAPGQAAGRPVGVLAPVLDGRYPRFLDPHCKTFVWGAPPVDRIGRLSDRKHYQAPF